VTGDGNSPFDDKNLDRGGLAPAPSEPEPAADRQAAPTPTSEPPKAEAPKQPTPTTPEEYEARWMTALAAFTTEEAINTAWRAEKDLRTNCRVTGDLFDRCIMARNDRIAEVRGGR
jgi:hypothetical protein